MMSWLKKIARKVLDRVFVSYFTRADGAVDKATQILLSLKYKEWLRHRMPLPSFEEVGFRAFSQNEEDGILLYIFSLIGTTNRKAVEIGAGNGTECNTANLIVNHGWTALLVDGNEANVRRGGTSMRDAGIPGSSRLPLCMRGSRPKISTL